MAKKAKVQFTRSQDLAAVDSELESAMAKLDESNSRIGDLLDTFDQRDESASAEGAVAPAAEAAAETAETGPERTSESDSSE